MWRARGCASKGKAKKEIPGGQKAGMVLDHRSGTSAERGRSKFHTGPLRRTRRVEMTLQGTGMEKWSCAMGWRWVKRLLLQIPRDVKGLSRKSKGPIVDIQKELNGA